PDHTTRTELSVPARWPRSSPAAGRSAAGRWQDASMTSSSPEPERPDDSEDLKEPDDPEDLKEEANRKFREALERKRAREAGTARGLGGKPAGNVQGRHGPARSRRSFRRRGDG